MGDAESGPKTNSPAQKPGYCERFFGQVTDSVSGDLDREQNLEIQGSLHDARVTTTRPLPLKPPRSYLNGFRPANRITMNIHRGAGLVKPAV